MKTIIKSKKKKIELAKKLTYENMRFTSVSSIRGVQYDGFEVIGNILHGKVATRLVEEIKEELRSIPRTFHFWVGVWNYDSNRELVCRSMTFSQDNLTIPMIDVWLSTKIQELIDEESDGVQGWAFIGTPNKDYDLEQDDEFIKFFMDKGVVNVDKANTIYEIAKLEKLTKVA